MEGKLWQQISRYSITDATLLCKHSSGRRNERMPQPTFSIIWLPRVPKSGSELGVFCAKWVGAHCLAQVKSAFIGFSFFLGEASMEGESRFTLVDCHAHMYDEDLARDFEEVLGRAQAVRLNLLFEGLELDSGAGWSESHLGGQRGASVG